MSLKKIDIQNGTFYLSVEVDRYLQQLKAEHIDLADELDKAVIRKDFTTWSGVANKLRQIVKNL